MSTPVIKQIGKSTVGELGRFVRALWQGNDWKISDAEFFTWKEHLHVGNYTVGDLRKSLFDYVHQGGIHKPRFGDLKPLLQRHKRSRIDKEKKSAATRDRNTTPDGLSTNERIKQILDLPTTSENESELYNLLRGKNSKSS